MDKITYAVAIVFINIETTTLSLHNCTFCKNSGASKKANKKRALTQALRRKTSLDLFEKGFCVQNSIVLKISCS